METVGLDRLRDWVGEDTVEAWRDNGLSDREADRIAVKLGYLPHDIWVGYTSAGLDYTEVVSDIPDYV